MINKFVWSVWLFMVLVLVPERNASASLDLLHWKDAESLFPRYSKFTVVDLETGMKFTVQRRAGSRHADVQPLTSKDTAIMKKIYGGKWSWNRRAIIVVKGNKKVPASMNGMPHGAGALKNNFPGHFCIHFYGSSTHSKTEMDYSHKLMVLKAADSLQLYFANADPYEVSRAYLTGFKEKDATLLNFLSHKQVNHQNTLDKIENMALFRMAILPAEDLRDQISIEVTAEVVLEVKGKRRRIVRSEMRLVRMSPYDPWKVNAADFMNAYGVK